MQRTFEPMHKQVEAWRRSELTAVTAKVVIYEAFVEGRLKAPKHRARTGHDLYFEPKYAAFWPRTIWSLSNAFTSAFKDWSRFLNAKPRRTSASFWRRNFPVVLELWRHRLAATPLWLPFSAGVVPRPIRTP
jgi:hypothetical protein